MNNRKHETYTDGTPIDWKAVFEQCYAPLVLFIRKRKEGAAKDIVLDAFVKVMTGATIPESSVHLRRILIKAAIRMAWNDTRRYITHKRSLNEMPPAENTRPLHFEFPYGNMAYIHKKVKDIIEALPARKRDIVRLRFYHRKKATAIAKQLSISEQTVHNVCNTARNELREQVGHLPYFDILKEEPLPSPVSSLQKIIKKNLGYE